MTDKIILKGISKSFGDKKIFENFSLELPKGSRLCIMGESGKGKTTLLNIIMGLVKPEKGSVTGVPNKIAAVFQEDRLCEDFTAVGNITAVTGKTVTKEKMLDCLGKLGLSGSENEKVCNLSGGMRRRVAIARALLAESQLIILDEPFKGLDAENRKNTAEVILSYAKDKTIILATHDPADAQLLGAEILNI